METKTGRSTDIREEYRGKHRGNHASQNGNGQPFMIIVSPETGPDGTDVSGISNGNGHDYLIKCIEVSA